MPFIMMRNTMTQEPTRQRKVQYLTPPSVSMLSELSSTRLNQKYCVSLDISHSGTVVLPEPEIESRGHEDQGSVPCRELRK